LEYTELTEIEASLQVIVRRAYDLGRSDALRKVVDVLSADRPCPAPPALMAPAAMTRPDGEEEEEPLGAGLPSAASPWWIRLSR
jgi:hypothetical protein